MKKLVVVLIILGMSYGIYRIVGQWLLIRFMADSELRSDCIDTRWLERVATVAGKTNLSPEVRLQKINLLISGQAASLCFSLKARSGALNRKLPEEYAVALRMQKGGWVTGSGTAENGEGASQTASNLPSCQFTNELTR